MVKLQAMERDSCCGGRQMQLRLIQEVEHHEAHEWMRFQLPVER
jgi:hypothetical protein